MEEQPKQLEIMAELTPNPNTLKFRVLKQLISKGSCNFTTKEAAKDSLLASRLFEIENVTGIMIGVDFVTVSKEPAADWQEMARDIIESIRYFLNSGEPAVFKEAQDAVNQGGEMEQQIRQILDDEIRPAVARDGGDIIFYGYEDGVVKLHLQGSCTTCPSSVLTLKFGIENRLKQAFPEIKEVVQV